jgi:predicted flavoprotein YhiN
MATGGKSYSKLGTYGGGWRVLRGLGHKLRDPYPALTPLKGAHPSGAQLSGEVGQLFTASSRGAWELHGAALHHCTVDEAAAVFDKVCSRCASSQHSACTFAAW